LWTLFRGNQFESMVSLHWRMVRVIHLVNCPEWSGFIMFLLREFLV
jgi:hypothetical protein